MVKRYFHFLLINFALLSISGYAQFTGKILDIDTEKSIKDVSISIMDGGGTISGKNGKFELNLSGFPVILKISHIAYHPVEIVIDSPLQSGLSIYLKPKKFKMNTVEIIGDRLKRFFKGKLFYIIDYDFIGDDVCVIGYENNILSEGRICLMNQFEDTLAYLSASHPKKLYRDAFNNLHLITKDSIYQLHYNQSKFYQLYPSHRDDVSLDLFQLKFVCDSKFLFKNTSEGGQVNEYYYIDTISKTRIGLTSIYNQDLYDLPMLASRYTPPIKRIVGRVLIPPGSPKSNPDVRSLYALRDVYERMAYDISIIHRSVSSLVFSQDSGFVIVDLVNDQLNLFSKDFEKTKTVQTNFPKHKQRQKLVIQDPVVKKLYWVYYKGSKVLLGEIDPLSGEVIGTLETPSFPFIENIKIRNGVIWFTYQPRLGETVRSLYRMDN